MYLEILKILSDSFIFENFSDNDFKLIQNSLSSKEVSAGEHLFLEGQEASAFFIIGSGKIKIYRLSRSGDEKIIGIFGQGESIAEAAVFDSGKYPATAQALENSHLVRVSRNIFISAIMQNPELSLKMLNSYSKKLRYLLSMISDLSFNDIKTRLANYIVNNAQSSDNETYYLLDMPKKELASLLGTIPETLSRALDFFKKNKLLSERDKKIIILDREKFRKYSEI